MGENIVKELDKASSTMIEDIMRNKYKIDAEKYNLLSVRTIYDRKVSYEPVSKIDYRDHDGKQKTLYAKTNEMNCKGEGERYQYSTNQNTMFSMIMMKLLGYHVPNISYKKIKADLNGRYYWLDMLVTQDGRLVGDVSNFTGENTNVLEEEAINRLILEFELRIDGNKTENTTVSTKYNNKNQNTYFDPTIADEENKLNHWIHYIALKIEKLYSRKSADFDPNKNEGYYWDKEFRILNENENECYEAFSFRLFVDFLIEQAKNKNENEIVEELQNINNLTINKVLKIGKKLGILQWFNNIKSYYFKENQNNNFCNFLIKKIYPDIEDEKERERKYFEKMFYHYNKNKNEVKQFLYNFLEPYCDPDNKNILKSSIDEETFNFDQLCGVDDFIKNNKHLKCFINALDNLKKFFSAENIQSNTYHPILIGNNINTENIEQQNTKQQNNNRYFFNVKNKFTHADYKLDDNDSIFIDQLFEETRNTQEDYYISIVPNEFNEINMYNHKVHNLKFLKTDNDIENFNQQVLSKKLVIKEGEEREKTSRDNIQNTIANTIIFLANLYGLTFEETSRIILTAIDNNGYSHIRNNNDRVGRNFSASFQKTMKVLGILTGKSKSTVGLRLKRLPKSIVEILHDRKEEFTAGQQNSITLSNLIDSNLEMNEQSKKITYFLSNPPTLP